MIGYKATDANMQCRGFQFELGKTYTHTGELKLCNSGFHFCEQPSGVWEYYNATGTRIFKVECEDVSPEKDETVGACIKRVCRTIKFLEEIKIDGHCNTGDSNTGDRNTGDCNTGDSNTGDRNTGDSNTGNCNTGNCNTGYRNTGYRNTGDRNTGDRNTGNCNTGNCNTGDRNTGYRNTGDSNTGNCNTGDRNTGYRNTGDSNATNRSAGLFCQKEPKVIVFDVQTKFTYDEFIAKCPACFELGQLLQRKAEFDYTQFSHIPGWTLEKIKSLHEKLAK
jgi:hypothetical protein